MKLVIRENESMEDACHTIVSNSFSFSTTDSSDDELTSSAPVGITEVEANPSEPFQRVRKFQVIERRKETNQRDPNWMKS
jgi:hypothetical protein